MTASLLAAAFAATAQASPATVKMVFEEPKARPGDVVVVQTLRPVTTNPHTTIYLVPMAQALTGGRFRPSGPPDHKGWIRVGPLLDQETGKVSRTVYTLPADLPPGDYTTGFWCLPCAPPGGATFTSAQPGDAWSQTRRPHTVLRVAAPAPAVATPPVVAPTVAGGTPVVVSRSSSMPGWVAPIALLAVFGLLAAVVVALRSLASGRSTAP